MSVAKKTKYVKDIVPPGYVAVEVDYDTGSWFRLEQYRLPVLEVRLIPEDLWRAYCHAQGVVQALNAQIWAAPLTSFKPNREETQEGV